MRLGIDIDGVLADFNTAFIALIRKETGIELPAPSDTYPDVWDYHTAGGVTIEQSDALWHHIENSAWWENLPGYADTRYNVQQLNRLSWENDVYYITTRPGISAKQQTERWLRLFGASDPTVLIAPHSKAKELIARGLAIDAFIDDRPENVIAVKRAVPGVFLLDRPWNRDLTRFAPTVLEGIVRVHSVDDMLSQLGLLGHMLRRVA